MTRISEPSDQVLAAYHEGRLSPEETTVLERFLTGSPQARARMKELAGIAAEEPDSRIREAVLASFNRNVARNASKLTLRA